MKIKKIKLKDGYKRFHNLTIDLGDKPRHIITLVGPNGFGTKIKVFWLIREFDEKSIILKPYKVNTDVK